MQLYMQMMDKGKECGIYAKEMQTAIIAVEKWSHKWGF